MIVKSKFYYRWKYIKIQNNERPYYYGQLNKVLLYIAVYDGLFDFDDWYMGYYSIGDYTLYIYIPIYGCAGIIFIHKFYW